MVRVLNQFPEGKNYLQLKNDMFLSKKLHCANISVLYYISFIILLFVSNESTYANTFNNKSNNGILLNQIKERVNSSSYRRNFKCIDYVNKVFVSLPNYQLQFYLFIISFTSFAFIQQI